jgi:hypothetical protein
MKLINWLTAFLASSCLIGKIDTRPLLGFLTVARSESMSDQDRQPLPDTPATQRIVAVANNRFGAVVSTLYSFWTARDTAVRAGAAAGLRRDAYSIVTFESSAYVRFWLEIDNTLSLC